GGEAGGGERLEEAERVAAAAEEGLGGLDGAAGVGRVVERVELEAHRVEAVARLGGIGDAIVEREGHEEDAPDAGEERADRLLGVVEVAASVDHRAREEEDLHGAYLTATRPGRARRCRRPRRRR